ncbi:hypothetical protein LTR53_007914, partial [Teratosphaeriaceae sp. CCFEE 6253]
MATSGSFDNLLKQSHCNGMASSAPISPTINRKTPVQVSLKRVVPPADLPGQKRVIPPMRPPKRPPPRKPEPPSFAGLPSLKVSVFDMPEGWTTWDVYEHLSVYGSLSRIELFERRGGREGYVIFRPPPPGSRWITSGLDIQKGGVRRHLTFRAELPQQRGQMQGLGSGLDRPPESVTLPVARLEAGVLRDEVEMLSLFSSLPVPGSPLELVAHAERKRIDLMLGVSASRLGAAGSQQVHAYKISIDFSIIRSVRRLACEDGSTVLIIDLEFPPVLYRKSSDIQATHDSKVSVWNDYQAWFRQTGIDMVRSSSETPTQLQREGLVLDVGRWLTYRLTFPTAVAASPSFNILSKVLKEGNIDVPSSDNTGAVIAVPSPADIMWTWAQRQSDSLESLHVVGQIQLDFQVRYQLETCLSLGVLHECNINDEFMSKLAALEPARATRLLEKVADATKRYMNIMDVFRLLAQVSVAQKKAPTYCAMIRGAVVTPTTIHYATPILETSNRIFRDYIQHEDRFLRVKFTDERYKGRIRSGEDGTEDAVLARVKYVLQHGIQIGERHYEFLAFGNSQFRENGAYFFAPIGGITAAFIRAGMGSFEQLRDLDRNVAKYASRLGQAFTTTRG